ncbi:MAG: hypothetical protein II670_01065 [Alphaproteobacteria bacterium]|nr:hypothetical protein [Alphaproteobacteria bacterium]
MEQKEKIKAGCNGIPAKNLANYVRDGVVSLDDLPLTPEKRSTIEQLLSESEETLWVEIKMKNTVAVPGHRVRYRPRTPSPKSLFQ